MPGGRDVDDPLAQRLGRVPVRAEVLVEPRPGHVALHHPEADRLSLLRRGHVHEVAEDGGDRVHEPVVHGHELPLHSISKLLDALKVSGADRFLDLIEARALELLELGERVRVSGDASLLVGACAAAGRARPTAQPNRTGRAAKTEAPRPPRRTGDRSQSTLLRPASVDTLDGERQPLI